MWITEACTGAVMEAHGAQVNAVFFLAWPFEFSVLPSAHRVVCALWAPAVLVTTCLVTSTVNCCDRYLLSLGTR